MSFFLGEINFLRKENIVSLGKGLYTKGAPRCAYLACFRARVYSEDCKEEGKGVAPRND